MTGPCGLTWEWAIRPEAANHGGKKITHMQRKAVLTLLFEGEVLCEMPALVVASEEEECGRMVDLQGPEEEHTLQKKGWV